MSDLYDSVRLVRVWLEGWLRQWVVAVVGLTGWIEIGPVRIGFLALLRPDGVLTVKLHSRYVMSP